MGLIPLREDAQADAVAAAGTRLWEPGGMTTVLRRTYSVMTTAFQGEGTPSEQKLLGTSLERGGESSAGWEGAQREDEEVRGEERNRKELSGEGGRGREERCGGQGGRVGGVE
eukprot:2814683-Rhodomonas_salina.1